MASEQMDNIELREEMREQPAAGNASWNASLAQCTGLGAAITAELMIGFWFGVGVILAIWCSGQLKLFSFKTYQQWQQMRLPLKMENNNVSTTNVEVPVRVTMKDPKKVAQVRHWLTGIVGIKKSWPRKLKIRKANLS